jgi:hypothetical protein
MNEKILGKTRVENEKLLVFADNLGAERVQKMLGEQKTKLFIGLASLLSKPNADDIEIIYQEKRYEAFWHIVGSSHYDYSKRNKYQVPVQEEVKRVVLDGKDYHIDLHQKSFEVEVTDHCHEEYRKEIMVNALSGREENYSDYLKYEYRKLDSTESLLKDGSKVIDLQVRAPFLVRQVTNALAKPIKADEIFREELVISDLNLFFHPVYFFEMKWKSKNKIASIAFDAVTGAVNYRASKLTDNLANAFTTDDLFDMGKELAASIIPGGGIAMMVGRKAVDLIRKK